MSEGQRLRIGLLGYALEATGGESRQMINFARGLRAMGATPVIFSLAATPEARALPSLKDIELHADQPVMSRFELGQTLGYSPRLAARLRRLVESAARCDVYVIAQDAALGVAGERLPGTVVQYCCGDLSLLLLDRGFRRAKGAGVSFFSLGFTRQIERHAKWARACDWTVANSRFTAGLMSYLYDTPFDRVIYPPVDTDFFRPSATSPETEPFALAILRGAGEPAFDLVERMARSLPITVVGGAVVAGARNLGRVSDPDLARLYSSARLTLSPSLREFFGYPIVESMACGTPALAFAQGGPLELIRDGQNGWLRSGEDSFLSSAKDLLGSEAPASIRTQARSDAETFSIEVSTKNLLELVS
jgi:hypothetical protein